ncbi:MAG: hypothetical protein C4319_04265 [Acidimicrobiia bacterium]
MRISVTAVAAKKSGASTLILEKLIEHLPKVAVNHHFRFFLSVPFVRSLFNKLDIDAPKELDDPIDIADNVDVVAVPPGSQLERLLWDQLSYPRLLKQFRPDVNVNALGFGPLYPKVPQCTFLQDSTYFCPMRSYQRGLVERARIELGRLLLLQVMARSECVVVPSKALAETITSAARGIEQKLVVLRDPFEADYKDPDERREQGELSPGGTPVRILYLSHLEPHKAHSFLPLVALELEKQTLRNFTFVVAIDRADSPRLYDAFIAEIRRTGTAEYFEVHPRLSPAEVSQELACADVFFFPSLCESFGYPMAEAGAAGIPVVASHTAINKEMLGEEAIYFESLRADKAAEALKSVIEDASVRRACARAIQRHQRSLFLGWEEYSQRAIKIITGIVDARKR